MQTESRPSHSGRGGSLFAHNPGVKRAGDYKQSDYGKVILPFTLLRRLDCVLDATKPAVPAEVPARAGSALPLDLNKALADPANLRQNLAAYIAAYLAAYLAAFHDNTRDIFDRYNFQAQLERLDDAGLLYLVTKRFAEIDLHPNVVDCAI